MNNSLPVIPSPSQHQRQNLLATGLVYILLLLGAVIMVGPFVWMLSTALKIPAQQFNRALIPNPVTLANFQQLWSQLPFGQLMFNSFKIGILTTCGQLLTLSLIHI